MIRSCALLFLLLAPLPAQRLYVDAAVTTPGNGLSWSAAFRTVQGALTVASPGTEVWVATGNYSGGFTVPAGVTLLGGFATGYLRPTQRQPTLNRATLDGANTQRVLTLGAGSVVDGFHVQNGRAPAPGGGGALIDGVAATVRGCVFRFNNVVAGSGGTAILVRNGAQPVVENCLFYTNGDGAGGDGIELVGAGGTYRNLTLFDTFNNAFSFRGGSSPRITNCVFSENLGRGILHAGANDTPILENALFFNHPTAHYRYIASELTTLAQLQALPFATGVAIGDPQFVSISANDFRPLPTSPMIEAGRTVAGAATHDLGGNWRALDGNLDGLERTDLGAHEFSNLVLTMVTHAGHGHIHPSVTGTTGLPALLLVSAGTIPEVAVAPFGMFALNPASFFLFSIGSLPQFLTIDIPPEVPVGTVLYFQAFAFGGAGGGNLSALADLQVN